MIVQTGASPDHETQVRGGNKIDIGVGLDDGQLLDTDLGYAMTVVHSPDALVTDLTDKALELGRLEILADIGDEVPEVLLVSHDADDLEVMRNKQSISETTTFVALNVDYYGFALSSGPTGLTCHVR